MAANCSEPFSVAFCRVLIGITALIVPAWQREEWKREWLAEIWHRWQFLFHSGEWTGREQMRLFCDCAGALPDAGWYFLSQERLQNRWREGMRSPWTCLGGLAALTAILAVATHGFPACRQMAETLILRHDSNRAVVLWAQPFGRTAHGMPSDVIAGWRKYSHALKSIGSFDIRKRFVQMGRSAPQQRTVVTTDEQFFDALGTRALVGALRAGSVAIDYAEWTSQFHRDAHVIGRKIVVGKREYAISAVLPRGFQFLSRQRSIYVVGQDMPAEEAVVVARVRAATDFNTLERELSKIAADENYYFLLHPELRITTVREVIWAPVRVFALTVCISALLSLCALRVRVGRVRAALAVADRRDSFRRIAFFTGKLAISMALVFAAGLEWARPDSSMLLTWTDGGSGPLIVWLFVFGTMAAFFWAIADQRGRCRVCLRLLAFPVRIGCPGCVLLDWSGTELLCSEGHGVLHVPHMATSWEEQSDRWVPFDESWRGLFAGRTSG